MCVIHFKIEFLEEKTKPINIKFPVNFPTIRIIPIWIAMRCLDAGW